MSRVTLIPPLPKYPFILQTERSMSQVCERVKTKNDMLVESIDQYKEMFMIAKREFAKVVAVSEMGASPNK